MNYSPWIRWHLSWPSSKSNKNFQGWKVSKQTRCWPYSRMTSRGKVNLTVEDSQIPQFRAFRFLSESITHQLTSLLCKSIYFVELQSWSASEFSRCWWKGMLVIRKQVECLIRKKLLHHVCSHFHINPSSKQFPPNEGTQEVEKDEMLVKINWDEIEMFKWKKEELDERWEGSIGRFVIIEEKKTWQRMIAMKLWTRCDKDPVLNILNIFRSTIVASCRLLHFYFEFRLAKKKSSKMNFIFNFIPHRFQTLARQ